MENLNFSLLALQFFKYQDQLKPHGIQFQFEAGTNLYEDKIVFSQTVHFKTCFISIQADLWDQYRQFSLWSSQTDQYHYRFNPVTGDIMRINNTNGFFEIQPSADLQSFGQAILQLIHEVANRLRNDRLQYNNNKMIIT